MAVKSGFFNSITGDRKYDAEDVNDFFEAVVAEGVFSGYEDVFVVLATTGMQISVGAGKSWFLKSWLTNTSDKVLTLSVGHVSYPRIDIIALDHDKSESVRENDIIIVEGLAEQSPVAPTLIDTETHLQIPLVHILVGTGVTEILQNNITNKIGTSACPFATGLIDQVDIDTLLTQWDAELAIWMQGIEDDLTAIETGTIFSELSDIRDEQIVQSGEIDAVEAVNATQTSDIDTIEADIESLQIVPASGRNLIINGSMQVNQRINKETVTGHDGEIPYPGVVDRWWIDTNNPNGTWTLSRVAANLGPNDGRLAYKALCTGSVTPLSWSRFRFCQMIEANRLSDLYKGTPDAKTMVLSWEFKSNVTGTYIVEIHDEQNDWNICTAISYTVSDVWESFEWVIPKDTAYFLVSDNTPGLSVAFWMLAGSGYTQDGFLQTTWDFGMFNGRRAYGQVNLGASVGNYFEITDIQLEIGNKKSDYERLPHDEVLLQCQRYMEFWADYHTVGMVPYEDGYMVFGPLYRARKRVVPVITHDGGEVFHNFTKVPFVVAGTVGMDPNDYEKDRPIFMETTSITLISDATYHSVFSDFFIDAELYEA